MSDGKTQVTFVLDDETEVLLKEVQIELGRTLEMKALVKEMAKLSLQVLRKRKSTSQTCRSPKSATVRPSASKDSISGGVAASAEKCDGKSTKGNVKPPVSKESASATTALAPTSVARSNNISLDRGDAGAQSQSGFRDNDEAIPLPTRRAVWRRDKGRCQYRAPLEASHDFAAMTGQAVALQFSGSLRRTA